MTASHPLLALLGGGTDESLPLAFDAAAGAASGVRRVGDLRRDVTALVAAMGGDRGPWLVETEDSWRVAVALMAATVAGARVVLPPNLQPGTLAELAASCTCVFTDGGDGEDGHGAKRQDPLAPGVSATEAPPAVDVARVDRDAPLVDLFTSGSSGPGKRVTKALRHLEDEVVELERAFGPAVPRGAVVLATVPAHHLYGLLFRVLWPLSAARAACRANFLLPDELLARVGEGPGAVIVSSPAHLRHLAASPRLREHARGIAAVFSSGGPLETRTALELHDAIGAAPIEIFGSTETGGVAFRRATPDSPSPRWTTMAPVEVAIDDGCLVVTSPFTTAPSTLRHPPLGTWRMGDRAEADDGGFVLLGRGDRVAKIGEKTVALPELEAALAAHVLVEAAAVGTWTAAGGSRRVGAVVVLTRDGLLRLAAEGRRALLQELGRGLADRWDRVALPRRWRLRDALPVDARGKVAQDAVDAELAQPEGDVVLPVVLGGSRPLESTFPGSPRGETRADATGNAGGSADEESVAIDCVVPRDLAFLAGHYDSFPLVPGVVQVDWALHFLARLVGAPLAARRVEALKFRNVLRPAQAFTVKLRVDRAAQRALWSLEGADRVFSSGRIEYAIAAR